MKMIKIVLLLIFVLLLFLNKSIDMFTLVAYNNTNVTKFDIDSTYSKETSSIQEKLDYANKLNTYYDINDVQVLPSISGSDTSAALSLNNTMNILNKTGYTVYNKNIDFPLSKPFKKIITDYIIQNNILSSKAYISSDLSNIYTKDKININ